MGDVHGSRSLRTGSRSAVVAPYRPPGSPSKGPTGSSGLCILGLRLRRSISSRLPKAAEVAPVQHDEAAWVTTLASAGDRRGVQRLLVPSPVSPFRTRSPLRAQHGSQGSWPLARVALARPPCCGSPAKVPALPAPSPKGAGSPRSLGMRCRHRSGCRCLRASRTRRDKSGRKRWAT